MLHNIEDHLCPHRGVGGENTLEAIKSGLLLNPFLLEFDVHCFNKELYLGHPPNRSKEATLDQALALYSGISTLPKIDVKLDKNTIAVTIDRLIEIITKNIRPVLINLSGNLNSEQYLKAERYLYRAHANNSIMLNIDLGRYKGLSEDVIYGHLSKLQAHIISVSPNLEDDLAPVITVARAHKIKHVHYWSSADQKYKRDDLVKRMQNLLDKGFEVYFDISTHNLID